MIWRIAIVRSMMIRAIVVARRRVTIVTFHVRDVVVVVRRARRVTSSPWALFGMFGGGATVGIH